jgi:hypothetical protein
MRRLAATLAALALSAGARRAPGATREELLAAATRVADRLAAVKPVGRTWEDVPYLSGALLLAGEIERDRPGAGASLVARVEAAVGSGDPVVTHGDYAGYAQAALELYALTPHADETRRAAILAATDGPLAFARRALRTTPADGPPVEPWWVEGGYGVRYWQDDLFTLPPGLARRGSSREGLPADAEAHALAYEWIESYVFDHRPASADERGRAVPSARSRAGFLLWDPARELFRHDVAGTADGPFWGRGNGWVGFGLATAARFLDAPYSAGRYEVVLDRAAIRGFLARLAGSLAARRTSDGGWGTDLLRSGEQAAESSATGLITFVLARGVNEGWLDRQVYLPIVLKAQALLLSRVDAEGNITGIQPPGTGPDGAVTSSDDPAVNVTYGVGAFLLAAAEVSRLPAAELARMEVEAGRPVDLDPFRRTWLAAVPPLLEPVDLIVTNASGIEVRAAVEQRDRRGQLLASADTVRVGPGATLCLALGQEPPRARSTAVVSIRATGDLKVSVHALGTTGARFAVRPDGEAPARSLHSIEVVPLHETLAEGEATEVRSTAPCLVLLGATNPGRVPATLLLEVISAEGDAPKAIRLAIPPAGVAFVRRDLPAGAVVRSVSEGLGGLVLPFRFPADQPCETTSGTPEFRVSPSS